jgi:geranylgeranyl diphosphate synthase type I
LTVNNTVHEGISAALGTFLDERHGEAAAIDERLGPLVDELRRAVFSGGKRLRPLFALWGYRAAGAEVGEPMLRAAASLEMLHTFALIQDDVLDRSPTRRGAPASHVMLATHAETGDRERFGASAAILLGDLALIWADRMLGESAFPPDRLRAGYRIYHELRAEVALGQYLDVLASHLERLTEDDALRVSRYKTATYTVQRPIQLGMALGGAPPELLDRVPAYAVPAGVAFQLRDDLLGAFGNPEATGKPSGEDLLERKPTWLLARTQRLRPEAARIRDVAGLRRAMLESGAVAEAESKIGALAGEALEAARGMPVPDERVQELVDLTERLVWRTS